MRSQPPPAAHTRVPNWLVDFVYPLLGPAEKDCLLYIVRRTFGFHAGDGTGRRKEWDRIALSQFVDGIHSGSFILDLGTGLSRTAVIKALKGLEDKQITRVSYECPESITAKGRRSGCGWSQATEEGSARPVHNPESKSFRCPRCGKTLSKVYALASLTPGFIKRFLNQYHSDGPWEYDGSAGSFYIAESGSSSEKEEQPVDLRAVRARLWSPELVDQIASQAAGALKSGSITEGRLLRGFYQPVLELQETPGINQEALAYALTETHRRGIAAANHARNWHRYARAVALSSLERRHGSLERAEGSQAEEEVRRVLQQCAESNAAGEGQHARQLLFELVSTHLDAIASNLGVERMLARRQVVEAFKRGLTDWRQPRKYASSLDYLPEWSWEEDELNEVRSTQA